MHWESVRGRLWPTRRMLEGSQRGLAHELRMTREAIERRLSGIEGRLSEMEAGLARLLVVTADLDAGQAETRTRLRRTQALTARAYEAIHDWPGLLAAARHAPEYEHPYTEAEPLISIAVSTYHSPDTLCDRALASVRAQSYENWEAIVVGDHCTDDTEARVRSLGDPRIRWHNLPVRENDPDDPLERWAVKGSVPRAVGVGLAKGLWIAPLSHDDAWDPDHLETLLAAARERRAEFVYSRMRMVRSDAPSEGPFRSCGAWPPRHGEFNAQASMFHGSLRFLRYDRACALASEPNDWNLARRAWEAGVRFSFVDRETATLYVHPSQERIVEELAAVGLPPAAAAYP